MSRLKVIRNWRGLAPGERGAAAAFGNFDGVHRGHQQVIREAADAASALGAPLGVISFDNRSSSRGWARPARVRGFNR